MIILPSYNGASLLPGMLDSICTYAPEEEVYIVDNASTDPEAVTFIQQAQTKYPQLTIYTDRVEQSGYETGAYVMGFRRFNRPYYYCFQDGLLLIKPDWKQWFLEKFTGGPVVSPWCTFLPCLVCLGPEHYDIIRTYYQEVNPPEGGCFGNNVVLNREAVDILEEKKMFEYIPHNKVGSETWERLWTIAPYLCGIPIRPIHIGGFNEGIMHGTFSCITKRWGGRV
jgi:glycosyltransferase involved in cell wall biosynthesis